MIEEIKYVMNQLGHDMDDKEIEDIIKEADEDGDGRLNYEGQS